MIKNSRKTRVGRHLSLLFLAIGFAVIVTLGGCSESTKPEPEPQPDDSRILSSLLSVAVIPEGSETIDITATDENGMPDTFSATSDDHAVATVTQSERAIEVTGVGFGNTTVTITSGSGSTKKIPVQVYNHRVLDVGELQISFVSTFVERWRVPTTTGEPAATFYHPVVPEGFHALGSLGIPGYGAANDLYGMMVVRQADGSDALARPITYQEVYKSQGGQEYTLWLPIAPDGYRAMGLVAFLSMWGEPPSLDDVVCVREDLTVPGSLGNQFWRGYDAGSWPDYPRSWRYLSLYPIEPPVTTVPHEAAYLHTGAFVAAETCDECLPAMNVIKADLPMLADAPMQTYVPRLEGYDSPPEFTVPVLSKVMLAPCTIINDLDYSDQLGWRIGNSPFYRVERQVFYKLIYHNYNQTSETQWNNYKLISGVSTTNGEKFYNETGISVTAEAGLEIKAFSAKVSTTFSRKVGYARMHSITELERTEYESSINTPPGKAAALWQKFTRLVVKRHNGTELELVTLPWEFGIQSYVTDEYPDEAGE